VGAEVQQSLLVLEVGGAIDEFLSFGTAVLHRILTIANTSRQILTLRSFVVQNVEVALHRLDCAEPVRNLVLDFFGQFGVGFGIAFGLENGVPAEVPTASGLDDGSRGLSDEKLWLFEFCAHVGDNAHSVACLVLEGLDHFGESFGTDVLEEPFDVGSWESLVGVVAEGGVLDEDGLVGVLEGDDCLFRGDFFRLALEFGDCVEDELRSTLSFLKSTSSPRICLNSSSFLA
jgi:hypothetical protein